MSLFHTIIATGVGTGWISGSVCWRKRGACLTPWKTGGGGGWAPIVSCIVLSVGGNLRNFINIWEKSFIHFFFEEKSSIKYYPVCLHLEVHLFSLCQRVLVCRKCGKSSRFSLECKGHSWEFAPPTPRFCAKLWLRYSTPALTGRRFFNFCFSGF